MKIPALAAAASMIMAPAAMAQVLTNTVTEYQLGGQTIDAKTQLPTGTAKISTGSPWNAILKIVPGSACAPNICPLSFLEVGFEMAGFTGLAAPQVPACSATPRLYRLSLRQYSRPAHDCAFMWSAARVRINGARGSRLAR